MPPRSFDVWHDRAVFHFLTDTEQRHAYILKMKSAIKLGGHFIISTSGPAGPEKCSGLDVVRYDAPSLHRELGDQFHLVESASELHQTPSGTLQQFLTSWWTLT